MTNKPALAISLTANALLVVLASWLLLLRHSTMPSRDSPDTELSPEVAEILPTSAATASLDEAKVVALARLEAAITAPPLTEYWKQEADQDVIRRMDAIESQRDHIRAELIARFGAAVAEDRAFSRLFKPLDARFPYLSSKSQLALLKLQRARQAPNGATSVMVRRDGPLVDPETAGQQQREFERNLRAIFTPDEWQQYELRESGTARQLRASGMAGDERQFHEAFRVLERLERDPTVASYVTAQDELAAVLGATSYAKFSAARDPAYDALQAAASRHGLTQQQLDGAYAAVLKANNEFARLSMNRASQEPMAPDAATQRLLDQRQSEVARAVGDDRAATDLIDAYMNQVMTAVPRQRAAF